MMKLSAIRYQLSALLVLILALGCSDDGDAGGAAGIKLNELLAISDTWDDWLELYNASDRDIDLGGFVLQDQGGYWTLPSTTLKAGGHLLVICDGSGARGRASFKLTSAGETLWLKDSAGALLDSVTFPAQKKDVSWGRVPDGSGAWTSLAKPSPGAPNVGGRAGDGGVLTTDGAAPDSFAGKATSSACTQNAQCLGGLCHRTICVSPYRNKVGQACAGDGYCLSLVCNKGTCAAGVAAAGTACLDSAECAAGLTCNATTKTCK